MWFPGNGGGCGNIILINATMMFVLQETIDLMFISKIKSIMGFWTLSLQKILFLIGIIVNLKIFHKFNIIDKIQSSSNRSSNVSLIDLDF